MSHIRRGEIRPLLYQGQETSARMAVVSNDAYNEVAPPIVVEIMRGRLDDPPLAIQLADHDNHTGTAIVTQISHIRPPWSLGEPITMLAGSTMERIRQAIIEAIAP